MSNKILNVTGLTPEQIEQIKVIIEALKAKNQLISLQICKEEQSSFTNNEDVNMSALFFTSEILVPFNRNMLYEQRT